MAYDIYDASIPPLIHMLGGLATILSKGEAHGGIDPAEARLAPDMLPLKAASPHLPRQSPHEPCAPGPFSFANPDHVRSILERAGFGKINITAHDELVGSGDLDAMLYVVSRVGALGKILRENPDFQEATLPAVRSALAAHDGPNGCRLNAATWVVTAQAQPC